MKYAAVLSLLLLFASHSSGRAGEVPWKSETYSSVTVDPVPIAELLRSFGADQGLPIIIDEVITSPITVKYEGVTPQAFLEDVTQANGLTWYFDGTAIYINKSGDLASEVLALENVTPNQLITSLAQMGVSSDRFPLKTLDDSGLVYIVGPPRHLEVVSQLATLIDERARKKANLEIVTEVFLLKYAWADNQVFFVGGTDVTVPGVASILDGLINASGDGPLGVSIQRSPRNLDSLIGQGLIRPRNQALARAEQAAVGAQIAAAQADAQARAAINTVTMNKEQAEYQAAAATIQPVIQADRRRNAIIIRDLKERMEEHRLTIEKLDVPHAMVQIEASIIDVDADHGFEFGPPIQGQWRRGGELLSAGFRLNTPQNSAPPIGAGASSGNLTLSLSSDGVTQFMANLQALETEGHARIVSKPSVLTLDNIEAFLNESEEFFVRVAGFEQADLFNVTVGTTMRIIPHIVYEPISRKVKLNISLEDGARSATASVDSIPVVSRNTINTQAVLMEGQSLLIAGLMRESTTKVERRVPVLGRLPVIGNLVKNRDDETIRLERMVLLTPTIVELPTAGSGLVPQGFGGVELMPAQPLPTPQMTSRVGQRPRVTETHAETLHHVPAPDRIDAHTSDVVQVTHQVPAVWQAGGFRAEQGMLEFPTHDESAIQQISSRSKDDR
ncbi:MAG: type III secretion system outer membrane ring subunit SctC [Planctomycetota bacterium]